jgi:hypothetical protein
MADNPDLPIAQMNRWKEGWTFTLIKFCILSVVFLICLILMFTLGSLKEITENFPKYRCNPMIMPFAGNFGVDAKENFNFCLTTIFNVKAAEIFAPIYNLLGGFSDIVKTIIDVSLGIRKLFSNFLLGVNNFIRSTRDRIQSVLFSIRMSFLKINNLMGRVYGTMYAVIWMGTSAMTAGFNLGENDLVRFLFEFCFDPTTQVELKDGTFKAIQDLHIGDELAHIGGKNPVVTSIFRFSGEKTQMVQIHDVIMSSEHYVRDKGEWIPAKSHISSIPVQSIPELVCINVSGHKFKVGTNIVVADYDEHDSLDVMSSTQKMAMLALNGTNTEKDAIDDYSLGIDKSFFVRMVNNSWKHISDIRIGESIWNAGEVLGIVQEVTKSVVAKNGNLFTEAQIVYDTASKQWMRAGILWPESRINQPTILYSLITSNCGSIHIAGIDDTEYFIRDYREVPLAEMEDAYEDAFLKN